MNPIHRIVLLIASLALLPAPLAASSTSECEDARAQLRQELDASGGQLNRAVAEAIKATVERCPSLGALTSESDPDAQRVAKVASLGPAARACGYSTTMSFHDPDSSLKTYIMVPGYTDQHEERAPADVAYVPTTDATTYDAHGPRNGIRVTAEGVGTLYLYGVPIPAESASAQSGCASVGGPLCWANAVGRRIIPLDAVRMVTVTVFGEANIC